MEVFFIQIIIQKYVMQLDQHITYNNNNNTNNTTTDNNSSYFMLVYLI